MQYFPASFEDEGLPVHVKHAGGGSVYIEYLDVGIHNENGRRNSVENVLQKVGFAQQSVHHIFVTSMPRMSDHWIVYKATPVIYKQRHDITVFLSISFNKQQ
jgi:hypothetical protein